MSSVLHVSEPAATPVEQKPRGRWAAILAGIAVLLAAGVMGAVVVGSASAGPGGHGEQWWRILLVEVELAAGLALLGGLRIRLGWWAALMAAAVWTSLGGHAAITDGGLNWTAGLGLGTIILLLACRRSLWRTAQVPPRKWRLAVAVGLGLPAAFLVLVFATPYDPELTAEVMAIAAGTGAPAAPSEVAQTTSQSAGGSSAKRDECDFGFVQPGSTHVAVFNVDNPSDVPLVIRNSFSECKCMRVLSAPESIDPSGSGQVKVELVAPKDAMQYNQRVVLRASDKLIPLRVKADVGLALVVEPAELDLGVVEPGGEHEGQVKVTNRDAKPLHLVYSTSSTPGCIARVPRQGIPAGQHIMLPLVVRVGAGETGPQRRQICIHTDHPLQPTIDLRAKYQALPSSN